MRRPLFRQPLMHLTLSALFLCLLVGFFEVAHTAPTGVFKAAIHWNISGDWLDPATTPNTTGGAFLALYLFHDALLKPMAAGMYTLTFSTSPTVPAPYF